MSNRNHNENYNEYVLNFSQNLLDELVEKEREEANTLEKIYKLKSISIQRTK